jgi:hypothetical protein
MDSDVTRCGSGSGTGVEHEFERHFFTALRFVAIPVVILSVVFFLLEQLHVLVLVS